MPDAVLVTEGVCVPVPLGVSVMLADCVTLAVSDWLALCVSVALSDCDALEETLPESVELGVPDSLGVCVTLADVVRDALWDCDADRDCVGLDVELRLWLCVSEGEPLPLAL